MKARHILLCEVSRYVARVLTAMVLALAIAGAARADFFLSGTQHLNVTTSYTNGLLYDTSTADVRQGGYIADAYVNDNALLRVLEYLYGTFGTSVSRLRAYNTSSVAISGGSVGYLNTWNTSGVAVSGGSVGELNANGTNSVTISGGFVVYLGTWNTSGVAVSGGSVAELGADNTSSVAISGGSVGELGAYGTSSVAISGGRVADLGAYGTSSVAISGGSVADLGAYGTSSVTIHGYDFGATGGLSLAGDEVLGTGLLTGKWFGGTAFSLPISYHNSGATILAVVPEPATMSLLAFGLGALFVRRRRRA